MSSMTDDGTGNYRERDVEYGDVGNTQLADAL